MKLEFKVCGKTQARKLRELGISQVGHHVWAGNVLWTIPNDDAQLSGFSDTAIAFDVAELGVMLQKETNECFFHNPTKCWSQKKSMNPDMWGFQAHCYANWLIHCLETKRLSINEVNKRIVAAFVNE